MPQENAELRRKVDFLAARLAEAEASARRNGRGDGTDVGEEGKDGGGGGGGGTEGPGLRRLQRDYEELQASDFLLACSFPPPGFIPSCGAKVA